MRGRPVDRTLLILTGILLVAGLLIFTSASLGLLARSGASFSSVAMSQFLAVFLGCLLAYVASRIHYSWWRKLSFVIFILSVLLTLLVFVPHIGLEFGGGKRWIELAGFSFQPAEVLKLAFVMYCAALFSSVKNDITTWRGGVAPLLILLSIIGVILLKQPDTDTFVIICASAIVMFVVAGGRVKHLITLLLISALGIGLLISSRPYLLERVKTFVDPASDPRGSGYQIQQSLIAVGSGELLGRGFGQSIQKFSYLPQPIGDSIFAVASEEFGFVGGASLIVLFLFFALRGFRIAARAPDMFGGLLTVGIVILIVSGSFMNIASMLGVIPLSGLPLLFVSHGGSAMVLALFQVGIILNVSKFRKIT